MDESRLLEDLRTAVRRYDIPDQTPVPDPTPLRAEVDEAITLRDQANLAGLLRTLPGLLTRATTYAHSVASPQGWGLLADVYYFVYHLAARRRLNSKDTGLPATRMYDVHGSTARAHLDMGERDNAQASLVQAFHVAPQKAKVHQESRDVLRVLISLHRRSNPQLVTLAKQAGLTA